MRSTTVRGAVFALATLSCVLARCASDPAASAARAAHPLDTAVLFPLPRTAADDALLRVDSDGPLGALLPPYASAELPALDPGPNRDLLPRLRVVALNFDPCFPSGVRGRTDARGNSLCRSQIRLIFQPVREDSGALTTDDVSVHTFYEMPAADFASLMRAVLALRPDGSIAARAPIEVHPLMRAGSPVPGYRAALQALVLRHAGARNLVKVTFSGLRGGGIGWQMGAVDFVGERATPATVPTTEAIREELINGGTTGDFAASIDPPNEFSRALATLMDSAGARAASDDAVRAAYRTALRIDNPATDLHPGNVDCASCHLATPLRLWAERHRGMRADDFAEQFRSARWNLELRSETRDETLATRCFGYYGRRVTISQRTVNEAAAVADYINDNVLGVTP